MAQLVWHVPQAGFCVPIDKPVKIPILGGKGAIYQRTPGGNWSVYYWVKAEKKRLRKSLDTADLGLATRLAEQIVLESLAKEQSGQKVLSASLGQVIDQWAVMQQDRLNRGEIRSEDYVRHLERMFRKHLGELYGLETPIGSLQQEDWDRYIPYRGKQGVALDTVRVECSHLRGLVGKVGMKLGAALVPELNVFVPKFQRSRRSDTFAPAEYRVLLRALEAYRDPDTPEGLYVRDWSLGSAKARKTAPKTLSQDLERSRRELLRWFVLIAATSGCRPHELAGDAEGSLRWSDIEFKEVEVKVSHSQKDPTPKSIALLHIREQTKTGARVVPMVGGSYLRQIKDWSRFAADDDFVFADQYGIRAGKPVYLDALRLHWREVLRRMGFERFVPDLYSLRHMWATRRLEAGAPPALIAKSLGHSLTELLKTYEHIDFQQESVVRSIWRDNTPRVLQDVGLVLADRSELKLLING